MPGFAWINEAIEHSDDDLARASALASKITALRSADEQRMFRRISDEEEGRFYDPGEDCECNHCLRANHKCDDDGPDGSCEICAIVDPGFCETRRDFERREALATAERDLEIELCEEKLARIGARMMRPYEHWNEDERLMEYMETRYDHSY